MTTNELIKLLKQHDPIGDCHIRIDNNPVVDVVRIPGYWDGPYNYIKFDEVGNPTWFQSTKKDKIHFYTIDLYYLAEHYEGNWEEMKKHIIVEYDYIDDNERVNEFMEMAKKTCDEYNEIVKNYNDNERKNRG